MKKCSLRCFSPQKVKRQLVLALAISLVCAMPMSTFAQVLKISLKKSNVSIEAVLQELEKQSGYTFFYNDNQVKLNKKVSVNATDAPIEEVLSQVFKGSEYTYKIVENQIVISSAPAVSVQATQKTQQQKKQTIKGVVKDAMGEPIIGASVIEKGSSANGTITNLDGEFTLTVSGGDLQVTYIGFIPQTIAVKPDVSSYKVTMREDTQSLDEVIVVGYSTQKRESLTGAMQVVKSDKLKDITTPSVENMLNGKAPGVYVSPGNGQPGQAGTIIIRGKSTTNGSTDPLWVIDGVIVGSTPGAVNPSDIESMTILKDAASTAIYGSQGANGVVVVTTKSAKAEKMSVNVSAKVGVTNLVKGNLEVMNGAELYDYYQSFPNASEISFPRWNDELRNSNFNWWDHSSQAGFAQDYNISLSGGNEKLKSFLSLGYYNEEGSIKGYDFSRYNFRYKTDYKLFDFLTVKPSLSGSRRDIMDQQYGVSAMYANLPWDSAFDKDGNIMPNYSNEWVNNGWTNSMYDLQWNYEQSTVYEFMGSFDFDIKITDWLTFSSVNNYKYTGNSTSTYTDPRSSGGKGKAENDLGVQGRLREYQSNVVRRYTNQLLRFNKMFGKHSVNALLAYEFNDYWGKSIEAKGTGFVPGFSVLDVTAVPEDVNGALSEWAVQSVFFNANYAYDNKYMLQLSLRRDGASNFGTNAKYGNFFSISGGWNINREAFCNADWLNQLKLRASYGSVGNRPTSLYPQYDLYSVSTSASYNGNPGALISQIGNKDLTWEKTFTTGIGLDVVVLDRYRMTFDYYNKNTSNLLYPVPVSGLTGVTQVWRNVGKVNNQGIELSLGADIIKTKDWYWSIDANLGMNRNEVKELYGEEPQIIVGDGTNIAGSAQKLLKPGLDSDTWYLREWAGVDTETGAPLWYKTVKNSDGTTSREATKSYADADEVACGAYSPDFFGGFSTNVSWKNISLDAVFGYSVGGKIFNYSRIEYDADGKYSDRNQMKLIDGWSRWEKPGDVATHPVAMYNNKSGSNNTSSRYLEDGDYLKLRSMTLSYNLSLPKYFIQNMRVFVTGENLFCLTGYSGVDPEIPSFVDNAGTRKMTGVTTAVYPSTRKFMFGVNVTF